MATNFPTSLDSFTNPSATDALDSVSVPHADQHADLNDAMEAVQSKLGTGAGTIGEWTAFTPSWSNLTVGNGTYRWARYTQINELVLFSVAFDLGSTSSMGTAPSFTVPVATSEGTQLSLGTGRASVVGSFYFLWPYMASAQINIYVLGTSSSYATRTNVTSSVPASWTNGSSLQVQGAYFVQ